MSKKIDNEELTKEEEAAIDKAADQLMEIPSNVWKLKLDEPLEIRGEKVSELTFNFGELTAADAINVEDEMVDRGLRIFVNNLMNVHYLMLIAIRANSDGLDENTMKKLPISDFNNIIVKTKYFLMGIAV